MPSIKNILIIFGLIVGAIGTSLYIVVTVSSLFEDESPFLESGEYGNLYVDREAGFQIEKPNQNWDFVTDYEKDEQTSLLIGDELLAVLSVQSRVGEHLVIEVYEENTLFDRDMEKIIDRVIRNLSSFFEGQSDYVIYNKEISRDGDYGSFFIEMQFSKIGSPVIQSSVIIQIVNEKAYILVPISHVLDESSNRMKEFQSVIDSFDIIP